MPHLVWVGARARLAGAVVLLVAVLSSVVAAHTLSLATACATVSTQLDEAALAAGLQTLGDRARASQAALAAGDIAGARAAYAEFDRGWDDIEDGVRARSRQAYRDIEAAMRAVDRALRAEPVDGAAASAQLDTLLARVEQFRASLGGASTAPAAAEDATGRAAASQALQTWAADIDTAAQRLQAGDIDGARAAFTRASDGWLDIEDLIRPISRDHYRDIERALADGHAAFASQPPDTAAAAAAIARLQELVTSFVNGTPPPASATTSQALAVENPTPALLIELLDRTLAALDRGDLAAARADLRTFQEVWLDVEGFVRARSASVYTSTENQTAEAAALLNATPPDTSRARAVLANMRAELAPVVADTAHYSAWDAGIILLREGFEALLVVTALVAFLQRSGNADKQRWVWSGAGAGIAASIVVAILAQLLLSRAVANVSREVIEGVTGLAAAVMLLYVGYWLHSKASLGAWQTYIRTQTLAALQRNRLLGLALIAFLAVFREGAETVLFYIGLAPSIGLRELLVGLAGGTVALLLLAAAMIGLGVRVPVRPFFLLATVLIYYLCFKFVGMSLHALQVAGVLQASPLRWIPAWELFGLFPTWETTLGQVVLLALIALLLLGKPLRFRLAQRPV
ncbi:MAG: FTR1 family protein [Chloroflexi bacterium]|nr:FTR1 family protein [Chloroflexota bacterium]